MDIEGTYTLQASPEEVWQCLMDQQVLRRAIPGVEKLELLDKHRHSIILYIKQAPLIGSYHGQVTISEQHYPYYYRIAIEGEGRQSTISGEGVVHLNERGENTVVAYKGTLNIGKLGTLLPPPLVKGTAKLLLQQFFTALSEYLRTLAPSYPWPGMTENDQDAAMLEQLDEQMTILPAFARPTPLHTIVHGLKLGGGDPTLEDLWVNRIRRVGILCGLLVLVWVGTKLPRRLV
jgi:uncharacterized protein